MNLLICDDSKVAQKNIARSLPQNWNVTIEFADNGQQALDRIQHGQVDLLFLDLTMPVMDGFEVLTQIRAQQLDVLVVVVSGDIQAESKNRVKQLGALGFVHKPIQGNELNELLSQYGLIQELVSNAPVRQLVNHQALQASDVLKEVCNIALGDAAKSLGAMLDTFIQLPIPIVRSMSYADVPNSFRFPARTHVNAVSEGFVGHQIAGEALLLLDNRTLNDLPSKLAHYLEHDFNNMRESVFLDIASLLIASFLKRFASQLDLDFNISQPSIVALDKPIESLLNTHSHHETVLVVDIDYSIPDYDLDCDLIVIFSQNSIPILTERAEYLLDA
ncbi:response regulator [Aliidiomarina celeris]|uniref:response regulator n=1 Tax=Aliidiomarina celeris TaxID=2249428 RepID=UPI000DEBD66B|nr:response regulator [Aliidiomarina celeris]